jgi:hypothetical protein
VGSQGSENVSHGCLNASPENAQWFFNNTKRGDVVVVRGTVGSVLSGAEGLGDWNIRLKGQKGLCREALFCV